MWSGTTWLSPLVFRRRKAADLTTTPDSATLRISFRTQRLPSVRLVACPSAYEDDKIHPRVSGRQGIHDDYRSA